MEKDLKMVLSFCLVVALFFAFLIIMAITNSEKRTCISSCKDREVKNYDACVDACKTIKD